jgi:uncharacterized GH25 family protein
MKFLKVVACLTPIFALMQSAEAHYPFVAPLSYQTFNNHTAVISGFYDNPFASEVAIKNFQFHFHTPAGAKIEINDDAWVKTQTLSSMSLENKIDGTYRIRGVKQGSSARFALDAKVWKSLIGGEPRADKVIPENVVYQSQLKKKAQIKTVQTIELIETFISRKVTSNQVISHLHDGFDVQFLTHPNAIQVNQPIQFKLIDDKTGIPNLNVEILAQTTDFSRESKVYQKLTTDAQGNLNFNIKDKGQYLLKVDYQQPFENKGNDLKRYKYTLAFNVI